jgi:hypothetical protein
MTQADEDFLTYLLRDEGSWISSVYGALLDFAVRRSIIDRYYDKYNPESRRSIILYVGNILKALGYTNAKVEEEDTYMYSPQEVMRTFEQFREFIYTKLCDNGLIPTSTVSQEVAFLVRYAKPLAQSAPKMNPALQQSPIFFFAYDY